MAGAAREGPAEAETRSRRVRARVGGVVQGVGFRPFVHGLATRLGLSGWVGNDSLGVVLEVEGPPQRLRELLAALEDDAPALAAVEEVIEEEIAPRGGVGFTIEASDAGGATRALVPPDVATCDDCLAEVRDPDDRRFGYAFTNCTDCGPRYTIVRDIPYDRPRTTMAAFEMCGACRAEYEDPDDRRFHAQPVCCPVCGPGLSLVTGDGTPLDADPVEGAGRLLAAGGVVAVKGLGGYHLAADATDELAVAALRARKHREEKPFALMVADLGAARELCDVGEVAAAELLSPGRPIVLVPRRGDGRGARGGVAVSVAPGNRSLGVMLPYTPLHHLLLEQVGGPVVLTSGNVSDEPIAFEDGEALHRLAGVADAFLTHDRPIHTRIDDSVVRVVGDRAVPVRRSRGSVPRPVRLPLEAREAILACGGELKSTFALAAGRRAFLSHHIGDLENYETFRSYTEGIDHLERLLEITPRLVAHDLHPEYLSTKYAHERGLPLVGVQHHHAHVASCLADHGETGPAIGVAFDGLGHGSDGTIWGGEVLVADAGAFERVGHLEPVPMPGGAAAIREPWRMAAVHLERAGVPAEGHPLAERRGERWEQVLQLARTRVSAPLTSSAGRLFDAVAATLGVRDRVTYEGQAAVELEQLADPSERGSYPLRIEDGPPFRVVGSDLVASVADDLGRGTEAPRVAARFHQAVANAVVASCERARASSGLGVVALSGGVFQNALLVRRAVADLESAGFTVLTHRRVPPNDGGISLGQAAVAAARASGEG